MQRQPFPHGLYVARGEERNIFPFQENADVMFNSATIYEISVLKQYAEPLLYKVTKDMPEYITAKSIDKIPCIFPQMHTADPIPNNSLIREFVGGKRIPCLISPDLLILYFNDRLIENVE